MTLNLPANWATCRFLSRAPSTRPQTSSDPSLLLAQLLLAGDLLSVLLSWCLTLATWLLLPGLWNRGTRSLPLSRIAPSTCQSRPGSFLDLQHPGLSEQSEPGVPVSEPKRWWKGVWLLLAVLLSLTYIPGTTWWSVQTDCVFQPSSSRRSPTGEWSESLLLPIQSLTHSPRSRRQRSTLQVPASLSTTSWLRDGHHGWLLGHGQSGRGRI